MTKIIGLTGGIGSGKTTVAKFFGEMGIPVYIADEAAHLVMTNPKIVKQITEIFGDKIFKDGKLDRRQLADIVFNSPKRLEQLNQIVHPAVRDHFLRWLSDQSHPFVIKEAAILFESGSYVDCDAIITVTAAVEIRIARVMQRDKVSRESVLQRINNQWTDEMRIAKSHYVIHNDNLTATKAQVKEIAKLLLNQ